MAQTMTSVKAAETAQDVIAEVLNQISKLHQSSGFSNVTIVKEHPSFWEKVSGTCYIDLTGDGTIADIKNGKFTVVVQ